MALVSSSSLNLPRFRRSDPRATRSPGTLQELARSVDVAVPAPVVATTSPAAAVRPAANRSQIVDHPLVQQAVSVLRNKHSPQPQFRAASNQLVVLLALEAARTLPTRKEIVETANGDHAGQVIDKPVVFLTVARHGLGLAHTIPDFIPGVTVGSISLERTPDNLAVEPRLHLTNAPALADVRVILFDPVVASGASVGAALGLLRRSGAKDIGLICFLASLPGLSRVQSNFPDLSVWTAAIDSELDPKRGPLPGLGNFAERMYGG